MSVGSLASLAKDDQRQNDHEEVRSGAMIRVGPDADRWPLLAHSGGGRRRRDRGIPHAPVDSVVDGQWFVLHFVHLCRAVNHLVLLVVERWPSCRLCLRWP